MAEIGKYVFFSGQPLRTEFDDHNKLLYDIYAASTIWDLFPRLRLSETFPQNISLTSFYSQKHFRSHSSDSRERERERVRERKRERESERVRE